MKDEPLLKVNNVMHQQYFAHISISLSLFRTAFIARTPRPSRISSLKANLYHENQKKSLVIMVGKVVQLGS